VLSCAHIQKVDNDVKACFDTAGVSNREQQAMLATVTVAVADGACEASSAPPPAASPATVGRAVLDSSAGAGRGTTALKSPGGGPLQGPPALSFAYPGETPRAALDRCAEVCRTSQVIAPPAGCRCWRGDAKTAHGTGAWVAAL
jgi:hypothetical protein